MTKEEIKKLKAWFKEEIERRDKIIEELRKENLILVKASIKASNRMAEEHHRSPKG